MNFPSVWHVFCTPCGNADSLPFCHFGSASVPQKLPRRRRSIATDTPSDSDDTPSLPKAKIDAKDITGLKFFKKIRPLLESLHGIGSERDSGPRQS